MMMKPIKLTVIFFILAITGCQKDFLDVKSDKKMVVPSSLKDLRALLDNTERMNRLMPYMTEIGSDDYYVTTDRFNSLSSLTMKSAYTWAKDFVYQNNSSTDWDWRYEQVFLSNLVLEGLDKIDRTTGNGEEWDAIRGTALFYRAWGYYQLSQLFCKSYDAGTATTDLGLPLKMESDINEKIRRSTIQETYDTMLADLQESLALLPVMEVAKTRPTRTAAYAFLARLYLLMGNYQAAAENATSSLALNNTLMDFNDLDATAKYPIPQFNDEVIFHSVILGALILRENRLIVDSVLYDTYEPDDLRKVVFFYNDGESRYKGSYDGTKEVFSGLAVDEVYLILAECYARMGQDDEAVRYLKELLEHRYRSGTELALANLNQNNLLAKIILERRKELVFRCLRWPDLRRLNKEPAFAVTIKRQLDGKIYELPPNDERYVLPIPPNVIALSGIEQNPR